MDPKFIFLALCISLIFVLSLWVSYIFLWKIKLLCICSTMVLIIIIASNLLFDHFYFSNNKFFTKQWDIIMAPGFKIVEIFMFPLASFDNLSFVFTVLWYVVSLIFWSLVFWGIITIILYIRRKCFCHKTGEIGQSGETT